MTRCADISRVRRARENLERLGRQAPELRAFQNEPAQMPSGAVGKNGYLRLEFTARNGRSELSFMDRRVPLLAQRALYWDEAMPQMPCVFIITTTGCILQGDRTALEIEVGENAQAHVTTQSAGKIHMMNANYAAQWQELVVEKGGYLEYMPEPMIPHRTSRFFSRTDISIAEGGSLLYAEMLLPGRKHHHQDELFGYELYSSSVQAARRENGQPLFAEKFILRPGATDLARTGVMNGFEIFGNVILLTERDKALRVREAAGAAVSPELAYGADLLPQDCGLIFKVLGLRSEAVREAIRQFWRIARSTVTGHDLPEKFLWR